MRGLALAAALTSLSLPAAADLAAPRGGAELKLAQAASSPARPGGKRPSAFGELGSNKDPIRIDADRLDVFDKEGRAVFAGNVVAVQGDSTMKCSLLTVYYEAGRGAAAAGQAGREAQQNPLGGDGAIRKINCKGPVTIVSKTQVASGDNAEFDRVRNKVVLVGNATLSDGPNVTRGERVAYDLNTGIANVEGGGQGGRVRALIVPGSQSNPGQTGQRPQR
ncbi:LptA/OstA family protein [Enterovirga aerilata]|uniref:Organic solvent tolerance protein OstA n=1 Tax=Enterovirga aerilata TaxID=2730920 RepID=A0A849ID52_9HYPH|nr:LptA/OstA family protein [Enterovirga sp. DB1703]NNM73970.1 organic solvent tolerance protein OstA [Enterovirga sp. DB1703]